jgi:hypothetical protein
MFSVSVEQSVAPTYYYYRNLQHQQQQTTAVNGLCSENMANSPGTGSVNLGFRSLSPSFQPHVTQKMTTVFHVLSN